MEIVELKQNILKSARDTIRSIFRKGSSESKLDELYGDNDYLEAYSKHTDMRVETDAQLAIGGRWEEIGALQFEFLKGRGMQPQHTLLDIGCGTLRGGRHFIKYLNPDNYFGMDISPKAISSAEQLVEDEGLSEKHPHLLVSEEKNLKFSEFPGQSFDYMLAQSVFTHLKASHIEECFENIGSIMHNDSAFYFTYNDSDEYEQTTFKDFRYPFSFFEALAETNEFKIQVCSEDYKHPRGQVMVEVKKSI